MSTRIKMLEEDLGVVLFERRHRGVRLTDAGRSFITEVAAGSAISILQSRPQGRF